MSAIGRINRAATEAQRTDRGENRIPAVWRARVVYTRDTTAECGHRPGVYITVPNFTRGEIHGPVQVVGDTPAEGALVVAVAVEGRKNDWIIITPTGMAVLEKRVGEVEALSAATQSQLDVLDTYVEHYITARMGALEWDVEQVEAHAYRNEQALWRVEDILEPPSPWKAALSSDAPAVSEYTEHVPGHGATTWVDIGQMGTGNRQVRAQAARIQAGAARSLRMRFDILVENIAGLTRLRILPRVSGGVTPVFVDVDLTPGTVIGPVKIDFNLPQGETVAAEVILLSNSSNSSGRIGLSLPTFGTAVERSA